MSTSILATPATPGRVINFAKILPLFQRAPVIGLVPPRASGPDIQLLRRGHMDGGKGKLQKLRPSQAMVLKELETTTFSVERTNGVISRANGTAGLEGAGMSGIDLPFGMPQFVNVTTLRSMLKAKTSDVLLKKIGDRWEICEDSMMIDLLDDSVEFRLGAIQILS